MMIGKFGIASYDMKYIFFFFVFQKIYVIYILRKKIFKNIYIHE